MQLIAWRSIVRKALSKEHGLRAFLPRWLLFTIVPNDFLCAGHGEEEPQLFNCPAFRSLYLSISKTPCAFFRSREAPFNGFSRMSVGCGTLLWPMVVESWGVHILCWWTKLYLYVVNLTAVMVMLNWIEAEPHSTIYLGCGEQDVSVEQSIGFYFKKDNLHAEKRWYIFCTPERSVLHL